MRTSPVRGGSRTCSATGPRPRSTTAAGPSWRTGWCWSSGTRARSGRRWTGRAGAGPAGRPPTGSRLEATVATSARLDLRGRRRCLRGPARPGGLRGRRGALDPVLAPPHPATPRLMPGDGRPAPPPPRVKHGLTSRSALSMITYAPSSVLVRPGPAAGGDHRRRLRRRSRLGPGDQGPLLVGQLQLRPLRGRGLRLVREAWGAARPGRPGRRHDPGQSRVVPGRAGRGGHDRGQAEGGLGYPSTGSRDYYLGAVRRPPAHADPLLVDNCDRHPGTGQLAGRCSAGTWPRGEEEETGGSRPAASSSTPPGRPRRRARPRQRPVRHRQRRPRPGRRARGPGDRAGRPVRRLLRQLLRPDLRRPLLRSCCGR